MFERNDHRVSTSGDVTSGGGGQRMSVECVYHHTFGPLIPLVSPSSAHSQSKQLPISIRRKGVQLRVSTGIDYSRFMLLSHWVDGGLLLLLTVSLCQ